MASYLERARGEIDTIDAELLRLLNRRTQLALELAGRKRQAGLRLRDRRREAEVLARARASNAGPLAPESLDRLFRAILSESRRTQAAAMARSWGAGRLRCA